MQDLNFRNLLANRFGTYNESLVKNLILAVTVFALAIIAAACQTKGLQAVRVIDGDTFSLSTGDKVRLLGMDAPEHDQPGGSSATGMLKKLILNKEVRLATTADKRDAYHRLLAYVYVNGRNVNDEMIGRGYAEVRYIDASDPKYRHLKSVEKRAETGKKGLWATGRVFQSSTPRPTSAISWRDAGRYYAQIKTIAGTIVKTNRSDKVTLLDFAPSGSVDGKAVIFATEDAAFKGLPGPPETYYLNKKVKVTGLVKQYNGRPEIVLKSPAQIEIVKP